MNTGTIDKKAFTKMPRTPSSEHQPHKRATVADVAQRAGVSTATVSRAINRPEAVRPELRVRIEEAIRELDYFPSAAARALVTRQSRAVGAIVPTLDNAIFASGISALQRRLAHHGYTLLIAASEYDLAQEVSEARAMLSHGVEGVMLIGQRHEQALFDLFDRERVAYVSCWTYSVDAPHPCIGFDNRQAARRLAEYVIDVGHRRIGVISGITQNNDRAESRLAGVRDAIDARGLTLPDELVVEVAYGITEGKEGLRLLCRASGGAPTAVICGNDVLATGALLQCQAEGIAVPDELSIVGFDDLPLSAHLRPALTTLRVPATEMGTRAADYLVARLSGRPVADRAEVETSLILRDTCAPPAQ